MAEGKKSFVLYTDLIHVVRKLPREIRGDLFLIILEYVNDHLDIAQALEEADILLSVTFEPIKQQLKRDLKEWEETIEKRKKAGQASADKRQQKKPDSTHVNTCQHMSTDNVNVNVNDNVLSKDNSKEPTQKQKSVRKQPEALQFPFTGPEFLEAWNKLITLPKWKKKPLSAIQAALNQLSKYDEEFSVKLIEKAHAGNYQGVVFDDTDEKFLKWKNQRNGKTSINNGNIRTNKNSETIAAAQNLFRDIASEIKQ